MIARGEDSTGPGRWDVVVLAALAASHFLLSLWLLPSGLLRKYPAFAELASTGRLSGEDASPASPLYLLVHLAFSPGLVRWLQCAVALGSMVLIYRVGRTLVDSLTGLISAGLFSLSAVVLVYGATLEPEMLLMAACLLGVWAIPRVVSEGRGAAQFTGAALFGGAMGVAFSLRPTAGLIALALLGGVAVRSILGTKPTASWRTLAVATVAAGLVGLMPMVAARRLHSTPVRGAMSPGTAFYDGNRPESIGVGITNPWLVKATERQQTQVDPLPDLAHAVYRRFARLDGGAGMSLAEIQSYWAGKSWAFARLEPAAFASGLFRKGLFLLAGTEYHDIYEVRRRVASLEVLPLVRYRWLVVAGVAGMLLAAWRRRMPWWLWGYWAGGAAGLVFFSVTSRYAMAFLPGVILFASYFLREVVSARTFRAVLVPGACLALATVPGMSPPVRWDSRVQDRVLEAHEHIQELMARRRDLQAAMAAYIAGQSYFPFLPSIMDPRGIPFESPGIALAAAGSSERRGSRSPADAYLQAVLWQQAGDCGRALPLARRAADSGFHTVDDSRMLDPHLLLAECLIEEGRREAAMEAVLASLEAHPATADGLAMAIAGSRVTGLAETAVPGWEERLSSIHDPLSANFALLRSHATWGDAQAAMEPARKLRAWLPGSAVVEYQVALLYAQKGDALQAFEALARAEASDPGSILALAPFEETLENLVASDPSRRDVWIARIDQAAQMGRFEEASAVAIEAERSFPEDREILELRRVMGQLAAQFGG